MGNEDQIKKDIVSSHTVFLPEEIEDLDGKTQVYSLEDEFARTKKNKNFKMYLFILGFIVFVLGGVYFFRIWQEWQDKKNITVNIKEFEDLRLKEAMGSTRKRGNNIDTLRIGLQMMEIDMLQDMLRVERETSRKEIDILSQGLPDEEMDRRMRQLRSDDEARLKKVRAAYVGLMYRKKAEINALEEARAREERQLVKDGADTRSNTDRLYALEMRELKEKQASGIESLKKYLDEYINFMTLKYNPLITAKPAADIINSSINSSIVQGGFLNDYNPLLDESGYREADFKGLRQKINNYIILLKRLQRVPYKNSIPPALRSLDNLAGSIIRDYENIWTLLVQAVKKKNQEIDGRNQLIKRYEYPFEWVLNSKKENGLILDPRDPANMLIAMNRSLKIEDGQTALVYNGSTFVGTIRLFRDQQGVLKANVVSMADKKSTIQPTNRIMLKPN